MERDKEIMKHILSFVKKSNERVWRCSDLQVHIYLSECGYDIDTKTVQYYCERLKHEYGLITFKPTTTIVGKELFQIRLAPTNLKKKKMTA